MGLNILKPIRDNAIYSCINVLTGIYNYRYHMNTFSVCNNVCQQKYS